VLEAVVDDDLGHLLIANDHLVAGRVHRDAGEGQVRVSHDAEGRSIRDDIRAMQPADGRRDPVAISRLSTVTDL
jgi:hypothetical protein